MPRDNDTHDPRGLIRESYRIEGISAGECRTIFLDWAISVPDGMDSRAQIGALLERYGSEAPEHPMTQVLRDALSAEPTPVRRGGARGRRR